MQLWRSTALGAYYCATWAARAAANRRAARTGRTPIAVLFYHRVADDRANEWTVSNAAFARQVHWLERRFDLVSLEEAQRRIRGGYNDRPTVALTFDDGYADNAEQALPLLMRRRIPCLYFTSTRFALEGTPFPESVTRGRDFRPHTVEELRCLVDGGVELGGHTRSHADLGAISDLATLRDEVVTASTDLAQAVGCTMRYFAFPFGQHRNLNPAAFRLAREAGFWGVCSAYGGFNAPGDDAFHLQRIHADESLLRMKNWLTGDPRKRRVPRYEYLSALAGAWPENARASISPATPPAAESSVRADLGRAS